MTRLAFLMVGGALALGASSLAGGQASPQQHPWDIYARPQRLVTLPDGRRANIYCTGAGGPVVVLEAGLAFPNISWRKVQPALSTKGRTCSYDRAGVGFSDKGVLPRSPERIADELKDLLEAADEPPPYVLVGSSYGGLAVRAFAIRHPDATAGMVLVDPPFPGQQALLSAIAPSIGDDAKRYLEREAACLPLLERGALTAAAAEARQCITAPDPSYPAAVRDAVRRQRLSPAGSRTAFAEGQALDAALYERHDLGRLPLIVLTAGAAFKDDGHTPDEQRRLLAAWRDMHRRLASESAKGSERLVPDAGHVIQSSMPDQVIAAINEMRARVGDSGSRK